MLDQYQLERLSEIEPKIKAEVISIAKTRKMTLRPDQIQVGLAYGCLANIGIRVLRGELANRLMVTFPELWENGRKDEELGLEFDSILN